ncbi:MAG: HNH endonuclease [Chloroflexi bacterium]|nr:HNH endonuclease [Chloroflexota bacterium]
MPKRPLTPCSSPGCPEIAVERGRCAKHQLPPRERPSDTRESAARRGYDAAWRRIRAEYLRAHRDCEVCGYPATVADHIVPLAQGGTHEATNLRALCRACHERRHGR